MARSKNSASDDSLNIPQSTGAFPFDSSPDVRTQSADNTSTGLFPTPGAVTITQGYLSGPVEVESDPGDLEVRVEDSPSSDTPLYDETAAQDWRDEAEAKVVTPESADVETKEA